MSGDKEDLLDQIQSYNTEYFGVGVDVDNLNIKEQKVLLNDRYKSNTQHRSWLSYWTASVVTCWLIAVIIILLFSKPLQLSDVVISILLGTTTLNVLGLSFIVLRGYFGNND